MNKILDAFFSRIQLTLNPIKYWRKQGATIGKACEIYSRANLGSEPYLITIGNHVRITDNVRFVTHDGGIWILRDEKVGFSNNYSNMDSFKPIVIKNNVHIGINSIIMPGVTIGENSIIGCGTVVTKDIPANSVAVGVPARVIKSIYEYENKMRETIVGTKNLNASEKRKYLEKKYKKI